MAEKVATLAELFAHELRDIYDAEHRLVDALGDLARESRDPKTKAAFESHREETRGHIERLEKVFGFIDEDPNRGEGCEGIDGLLDEKEEFDRKNPSPEVLAFFNLTAAAKTERYEISVYEGLIRLAEGLGLDEGVGILQETLAEEEAALEKVRDLAEAQPIEVPERARSPRA